MATTSNDKIFQKYLKKMKTMNKMVSADEIYRALLNGKNTYLRMSRSESSHFDPSWIKVIEDCIYDLGEIVNNPRQVTKTESSVVPVELAKKINGESVQHLASHTQYIKDINEQGDVVPSKILSHYNEDNIHTYENRFIATFIRRLVLFIEKRYSFIMKTITLYYDDVLIMKNTSVINGQQVEIETKIRVKRERDDDVGKAARAYADRIIKMREYITYYYNSSFMRQMKNERDVRKPILQTNIIRKNPKYRHCYEAFLFIERFDSLGVTYKVAEDYLHFDAQTRAEMNYLFFSTYLSLRDKTQFGKIKTNDKIYKPRILTSLDDEKFVYGPYLKGPIEFVRVDEQYRKYLETKVYKKLPLHPTKQEKEYYADEYEARRKVREEEKELDRLIARKQKEVAKFEKEIAKIIAQREKEEAELERLRQQEIKDEEDRRIEAKRQEIIAAAKARQEEMEAELEREREELVRLEALALASKLQEAEEQKQLEEEVPQEQENENNKEVVEEQPVLDTPIEEEPVVEPVEESQPIEEPNEIPVSEESIFEQPTEEPQVEEPQAEEIPAEETLPVEEKPVKERKKRTRKKKVVEEPKEEPAPEQVVEEQPVEEQPTEEQPVEETTAVEKAPAKETKKRGRKKKIQEEPKEEPVVENISENVEEQLTSEQEEQPHEEPTFEQSIEEPKVEEEAPVEEEKLAEEPMVEEPQQEAPIEEPVPTEEQPVKKPRKPRAKKKATKKPAKEEQPVKEEKKSSKPRVSNETPEILQVIPGKFIVKAYEGYYVNDKTFSVYKKDAKIFYDFNLARQIKARFGGKVVKL